MSLLRPLGLILSCRSSKPEKRTSGNFIIWNVLISFIFFGFRLRIWIRIQGPLSDHPDPQHWLKVKKLMQDKAAAAGTGNIQSFHCFGFPSFDIVDYVSNAKPLHEVMKNCKKFCPIVCICIETILSFPVFLLFTLNCVCNELAQVWKRGRSLRFPRLQWEPRPSFSTKVGGIYLC